MSLRDMCVLEPATAAPRKARRKIGGAGSRTGRAIRLRIPLSGRGRLRRDTSGT